MPAPLVVPLTVQSVMEPLKSEIPAPPVIAFTAQRETATFSPREKIPPLPAAAETVQSVTTEFSPTWMPSLPLPATVQSRTRALGPRLIASRPLPCTTQDSTVTFEALLARIPSRKTVDIRQPEIREFEPTCRALPDTVPPVIVQLRTITPRSVETIAALPKVDGGPVIILI